ncbi:MAG: hypothetical protein LBU90_10855 [Bacteroidales bacterium]|jgi:hypothetical protein|nr:hypothetical protein [Bacteroidales bacterium]
MKKKIIGTITSVVVFLLVNIGNVSAQNREKDEEMLRGTYLSAAKQLWVIERANPQLFLSISGAELKNQRKKIANETLFENARYAPDGALLEGVIRNEAAFTSFQDIRLQISYISKTGTVIKKQDVVLYEYAPARDKGKRISLRISQNDLPQDYASFEVKILGATEKGSHVQQTFLEMK